ncbi:MAG UNVERIFIED_CONTAM: arginine--tRNA ligase [Rickettsiaceae bacterium]|jgi:arginyl-tRNA synthetase
MNIYSALREEIVNFVQQEYKLKDVSQIVVESPKDSFNGDLASNAAMAIASQVGEAPRNIAMKIKDAISGLPYIAHIEIAGPGFINFTIHSFIWQNNILEIAKLSDNYGFSNFGKGKKVNIEYVSANPTGPMHIGHARGAVYGDALANLLSSTGYNVVKEYYINDAGSQIDTLMRTALLRYKEAATNEEIEIPEGLYPGEYMIPVGKKLFEQFGDKLLSSSEEENFKLIKKIVIDEMLSIIKQDLLEMGIKHDVFFSESSLYQGNKIEKTVEKLTKKGLVFKGTLPPPKGKPSDDWIEKEQLLFKSTAFGDDQDRPLQKGDGSWAYFASDVAYAGDKIDRGFDCIIVVLGADHGGYVKRMEAAIKSLSDNKVDVDIKLCQLVNYLENGDLVKMSKRAGTFTTVSDVIKEVGKDIVRFIMLTRKNDIGLDFDLNKVKEQSKDNPVFYVNYAHVRALSIIAKAKEVSENAYNIFYQKQGNVSLLSTEEEIQIMKLLASWPKILEGAAIHFEPHRIAFFLQNLSSFFHALWNLGKENNNYRFIVEKNVELTAARLMLVDAVRIVIATGLRIIGTEPMEKM